MPFELQFSPRARDHLKALRKRDRQIVIDSIEAQLRDQPNRPTRNRKQLEENPLAPWELRIGDFRVFYDVSVDENLVAIVAVGKKSHNRLWIGDEEVEL